MSVINNSANEVIADAKPEVQETPSVVSKIYEVLCSVRFGIILLIIVGLLCFLGMIIMQQNVDGFDRYYAQLTPAQRMVYGGLGLFDVYHSVYFNASLLLLSLNILLSSIDRFPKTWKFISRRKTDGSEKWILGHEASAQFETEGHTREALAARIGETAKKFGWKSAKITEKGGKTFVSAESGVWNRFAYLAVHVGLLIIFLGGFMTGEFGTTGQMSLHPGQTSNQMSEVVSDLDQLHQVTSKLPFDVTCIDIQQKLIKNDGAISAMNTIDWITTVKIKDETGTTDAVVQMNRPFDYRGYRFFQSSFVPIGRARNIDLRMTREDGTTTDVKIPRDGMATLDDGTIVRFVDFRGNFSLGKENPNEDTSEYPNPAAVLQVTTTGGETYTAYAFGEKMKGIPIASKPIAGFTYKLLDFEKVGEQHVLSIQRDPGATVVYVGFIVLTITLIAVFFFSHQRVWASIEEVASGRFNIISGGDTNRNQTAFTEKFGRFVNSLTDEVKEAKA